MAKHYLIGVISYYELEYDQPQDDEVIREDFWKRYDNNELGQGELGEIELIEERN